GLYGLSYKMLVLPTMLVGQAVQQVFLSRAAMVARDPGRLRQLTERTALALFAGGLPLFGVVALGGPQLFGAIMGHQWEPAGRYAQILAPWFVVWLVSNPLSGLFTIREWQASALAFTASEFALRLGALLLGVRLGSPTLTVGLISVTGVIISVASIVRFMRAGYSSIGRVLGPAARLFGLATVFLVPAAIALHNSHEWVAMVAAGLAIATYYGLLLRSGIARRLLHVDLRDSGTAP
ncbi:MAG TPA: oligosaccharide flippase family protein, partial [Gemmatimonadales bacterium]